MMNAMFMLLNSIEARSRFGRTITALGENSPRETEFSHEQFPFHLDDNDSIQLGEAAANSTHLTQLCLDVSAMTTAGTRTLIPAISKIPSLNTLRLEGDVRSGADWKRKTAAVTNKLIQAAHKNPAIRSLHLSGTHFGSPCVTNLDHLDELVLHDVWHDANPSMVERLASGIRGSSLRICTMNCVQDHLTIPLLEALTNHPTIRAVSVARCLSADTAKAVRSLLDSSPPNLEDFQVWGTLLNAENWGPVVQGLVANRTVQLLVVGSCTLHATVLPLFAHLLRSSTTLRKLNLTESVDTVAQLRELVAPLHRNTSLQKLDVCKCDFGPAAGPVLSQLLRRNRGLEQLDLDRNRNVRIAPGLIRNQTLLHLDVSMTDLGDDGFAELAQALVGNTTITHLLACGNEIENIQPLTDVLVNNPHSAMTNLYLHGNPCGNAGAKRVAQISKLRAVYMDHCHIGAPGAAALLCQPHMQHLSLRNLDLRGDTAKDMEDAMSGMATQLESLSIGVEYSPSADDTSESEDDDGQTAAAMVTRAAKMKDIFLDRAWHLQSLVVSDWFQVDPEVVAFVLERNAARAVTAPPALWPHVLAKLKPATVLWWLRRDPAAWVPQPAEERKRSAQLRRSTRPAKRAKA